MCKGSSSLARKLAVMSFLDKLLRRSGDADHAKWLAAHPGKGAIPHSAPPTEGYDQSSRDHMEKELEAQRAKMDSGAPK